MQVASQEGDCFFPLTGYRGRSTTLPTLPISSVGVAYCSSFLLFPQRTTPLLAMYGRHVCGEGGGGRRGKGRDEALVSAARMSVSRAIPHFVETVCTVRVL